jgi:threonine synthase
MDKRALNGIILETAHPAKFIDTYEDWMKGAIEIPERLRAMMEGTKKSVRIAAKLDDLKSFLMSN